ncbi:MAG: protein kinase [Deltaproteobacteria bacterium]
MKPLAEAQLEDSSLGNGQASARQVVRKPLARGEGLGRFSIERLVGRGAAGLVYAAHDRARGRVVALKTLQVLDPLGAEWLKQEFRALRGISHPNLVRLHELFADDEQAFFTMDLIDGVPFDQFVRGNGTPGSRRLAWQPTVLGQRAEESLRRLLIQLACGIEALHRAGKLHRDLKPANVLVEPSGRLVILDFGLVLDRNAGAACTSAGGIAGTPGYMAPELFRWQAATEKSDWYSAGAMLYETLTGELPQPVLHASPAREARHRAALAAAGVRADLQQLCSALLEPSAELRADTARVLEILGSKPLHRWAQDPLGVPLVGRDGPVSSLQRAHEECRAAARPRAVFVSGPSGIGKTALLAEFVRRHGEASLVLSGRCHEQEAVSHEAFEGVIDALVAYLSRRSEEAVLELVPAPDAPHLIRLFPGLARVPTLAGFAEGERAGDPRERRALACAALRHVLRRLGTERPLTLIIDDLQWADLDSAQLLYELFSEPEPVRCLLVLAFRPRVEDSPCLERLLGGSRCLADLIDVDELQLAELDPGDARALAEVLLSGQIPSTELEAQAEALCREASGSPLLIHEIARYRRRHAGTDEPRVGLRDVVRDRLRAVSERGRRLFELVCVAGTPVREDVLCGALGEPSIDAWVIELESERLIQSGRQDRAGALETVHDAIRAAALAELPAGQLCELHARLAAAYATSTEPDVEALARHYAGSEQHSQAAAWAERAAARAGDRLAFHRAAELYRLAFSLQPAARARLQPFLANVLADAGRGQEAAAVFIEVARACPAREALAHRQRAAEQWLVSGHIEKGLAVMREVFSELGVRLPRSRAAALASLVGSRLRLRLRGLDFSEKSEATVSAEELLRVDACRSAGILSFVRPLHGSALQAQFLLRALAAGEPERIALGMGMEAVVRGSEGRWDESAALRQRGWALARRSASPHALAFQHFAEGYAAYLAGQWQHCVDAATQADRMFTQQCRGSRWELNTMRFFWGNALVHLGCYRELRRRLRGWLTDAENRDDRYARAAFRLIGTRSLRLAEDDPAQGLEDIRVALGEWSLPDLGVHRFLAEVAQTQILLYQDRREQAWSTMQRLLGEFQSSSLSRVQLCRIHAHHHAAATELAMAGVESLASSRRHLQRAARHQRRLEAEGVAWARALAQHVAAARLLLEGRAGEAAAAFEQAIVQLNACGMRFYEESAAYRLAQLRGGNAASPLLQQATVTMAAQGVRVAARLAQALAPGS